MECNLQRSCNGFPLIYFETPPKGFAVLANKRKSATNHLSGINSLKVTIGDAFMDAPEYVGTTLPINAILYRNAEVKDPLILFSRGTKPSFLDEKWI